MLINDNGEFVCFLIYLKIPKGFDHYLIVFVSSINLQSSKYYLQFSIIHRQMLLAVFKTCNINAANSSNVGNNAYNKSRSKNNKKSNNCKH